MFPGKKVIVKNGKIFLKDKGSSQRKGTGKTMFSYINKEKCRLMEAETLKIGKIFIPYEVMSSKNSRVIKYVRKKGQKKKVPTLDYSEQYKEYMILTKTYWKKWRSQFLELIDTLSAPYRIGFFFHRCTKGRFDYPNMMQGLMDQMIEHGWLPDDNMDIIMPIPDGYLVDKEIQGVIIQVYENV